MAWTPMFALPNVNIQYPVEVPSLALVHASDQRVLDLAEQHKNFDTYINCFCNEFGDKLLPSLLIWDDNGPPQYRNTEAISSFRDVLALSVVPTVSARALRHDRAEKLRYSNWFNIYPWMIDKNYEHVIMRNSAVLALHDTNELKAQTYPGLYQEVVGDREVDSTLFDELKMRWQRRFQADRPDWNDMKLFRSLNMANIAATLPSHGDFTPFDLGRAIALWVSAFEILTHPGQGKSGYMQVYELFEKVSWGHSKCIDEIYEAASPVDKRKPRNLACWIYSQLNAARNDYLHGNAVTSDQLILKDTKRHLPDYTAVLYRMALTGFLDLTFKGTGSAAQLEEGKFNYQKYQRDMEAALVTILISSEEEQRRKKQLLKAFRRAPIKAT